LIVEKKEANGDESLIEKHTSNTTINNLYNTNLKQDKQVQSQLVNDKIKTNKIEPEATSTEINKNNTVNFDPHDTKNENIKELTVENKQNIFNNQDSIQKIISDPVEVSAQIITENLKQDTIQKSHNAMQPQIQHDKLCQPKYLYVTKRFQCKYQINSILYFTPIWFILCSSHT
jgi:hypothetical protein